MGVRKLESASVALFCNTLSSVIEFRTPLVIDSRQASSSTTPQVFYFAHVVLKIGTSPPSFVTWSWAMLFQLLECERKKKMLNLRNH